MRPSTRTLAHPCLRNAGTGSQKHLHMEADGSFVQSPAQTTLQPGDGQTHGGPAGLTSPQGRTEDKRHDLNPSQARAQPMEESQPQGLILHACAVWQRTLERLRGEPTWPTRGTTVEMDAPDWPQRWTQEHMRVTKPCRIRHGPELLQAKPGKPEHHP